MILTTIDGQRDAILKWVRDDPSVLSRRDPVNATPLLLLVLFNHIDIAKEVLEEKPKHIADSYGSGPYEGENCLHIAIVNRDLSFASFLCARCPALLHQRAKGSFFAPGMACYYGELPLSFAASTRQTEMVHLMLRTGARIDAVDSFRGNNALHHAILHDCIDQYKVLKKYCDGSGGEEDGSSQQPSYCDLPRRRNKDGLSCIELCAAVGSKEAFEFLIEDMRETQWTYG